MDASIPVATPYRSKKPLTSTEVIFYGKLVEALPEYVVLAQVQLQSFIKVSDPAQLHRIKKFYSWQNPIAQQSVDYLVCRKGDFAIIAAIELDDKSHDSEAAKKRDEKKNQNIASAGITLIRWHAEHMPDVAEIRAAFNADQVVSQINSDVRLFEKPKKTQVNSVIPILILALVVFIAFNVINHAIPKPLKNIQPAASQITNQLEVLPVPANQELSTESQAKPPVDDARSKELAWDTYYKQSEGCASGRTAIVECGNEYIRARRTFDAKWSAKNSIAE